MPVCWRSSAVLLVLATCARAVEERPAAVLPGESKATSTRVAEARRRIADKQWPEALDELQAVLDAAGDDLVSVDGEHLVQARRLVHALIAGLPADALKLYRSRADTQARRWLEQGTANRDAVLLRKVVDEAFCSRPGERALELLGDLAFERGRFDEADAWWQLLAPTADAPDAGRLAYPDPRGDVARVRAKQLMALHFSGDARWSERLAAFRAKQGAAEGVLGGRKGKYVDLLTDLAARPADADEGEPAWSSFGGDATRGRVQPAPPRFLDRLGILARNGPDYRINLDTLAPVRAEPLPSGRVLKATDHSRSLAFHPLIVGRSLYVADAFRVVRFDLRNGVAAELYRLGRGNVASLQPDSRYTLTAADGCLYARLGAQRIEKVRYDEDDRADARAEVRDAQDSQIVCLGLDAAPGDSGVRWVARALSDENLQKKIYPIFEGAPVVRDGLVYAAATRVEAERSITAIHCYAADPPPRGAGDEPPGPLLRWKRDVCETRELQGREPRYRHHQLTLAGTHVVYCSHSGAAIALDARTGKRAWAVRYPAPQRVADEPAPLRDLTPCVFADGCLYAAPADGNRLLCLDPATGRTLWQREPMDVVHLLGVGHGRLIFATPTGLRAVNAANGDDAGGWSHETRTDYGKDGGRVGWTPAGRGFLAGDYVLWPTLGAGGAPIVHAVRQETGEPDDNPTLLHRIPAGNLVFVEGCLAVAGREVLSIFVPPAWRLPERERDAKAAPASASATLALARAESDAGRFAPAAEHYRQVERLGQPRQRHEARRERHALWLEAGRRAAAGQRWEEATAAFRRATDGEFTPADRAAAWLEAGAAWEKANRPAEAAAAWQAVLDADEMRDVRLHNLQLAGYWAALKLEVLAPHSRHEQEKAATAAFAAAKSITDLDRIARRFPYCAQGREALERLARQEEMAGRLGAAADAWRRLQLQYVPEIDPPPPAALAGLARAYERQGCMRAARVEWQVLAEAYGDLILPEFDTTRPLRDAVANHLRAMPADTLGPGLPLRRAWEIALDPKEELLPSPGGDAFLTALGGTSSLVICRSATTGRECWRAALAFPPSWATGHDDLILLAGAQGIAAVRREDGVAAWTFVPPPQNQAEPLTHFRYEDDRLFCFWGGRFLAFYAGSGNLLWQRRAASAGLQAPPPAGRFVPCTHVGRSRVLLQTVDGHWQSLLADTGGHLHDAQAGGVWTSDPIPSDDRNVIAVEGSGRVVCFDSVSGRECWPYILPGYSTRTGAPPRVVVRGGAILLLVEQNIGYALQRLDRATGKPLWPRPMLLREPVADPRDWTGDADAMYLVEGGVLTARALTDGRPLWTTTLGQPARQWRVERWRDGLLAYPATPTGRHFTFCWLTARVQWTMVPDVGESVGRGFPVLCLDAAGRVKARLDLASGAPALLSPGGTPPVHLSVLPRLAVWRGATAGCPPVQMTARGAVVVVGPRAWGLTGERGASAP